MAILQCSFFSQSLMRAVPIQIILPTDGLFAERQSDGKPLKALYLLHGLLGNCSDWVYGTQIPLWAHECNLAVFMPSGDNKFYVDQNTTGERYGSFIRKDLVEFTRRSFPLSHKREDTFIGGLSMGGYGAIVNALQAPYTFGAVCALSSALILDDALNATEDADFIAASKSYYEMIFGDINKLTGSDKDYFALAENLVKNGGPLPNIYMACGAEDGLIAENYRLRDKFNSLGYNVTWEEGPGNHDFDFWNAYIRKALDWLPVEKAPRMPPPPRS